MRAEVRGRNRSWKVYVQDASDFTHPVPVYDQDGNLKETILCAAPTGKLVESYFPGGSREEAEEYARWLGATEIVVTRTRTKQQALAIARSARHGRKEDE